VQNLLFAVSTMPNLTHLRLTDITLDPLDGFSLPFNSVLYSLVCEDVGDMDALGYFIEYVDQVTDLTLTRCAIKNATYEAETLILKAIDYGVDYLDNILRFWTGRNLHLESCPGFDDALLERICDPSNPAVAKSMKALDISNCLDFSVPALKRFVESRERGRSAGCGCPALESMRISGDSPYFSHEDILWFKEHLTDLSVVCE
jgi:hypothetical protein